MSSEKEMIEAERVPLGDADDGVVRVTGTQMTGY